jgi:hypothetical protein
MSKAERGLSGEEILIDFPAGVRRLIYFSERA